MNNQEPEKFDESLITTEPVVWNDTDVTVRYKGQYAGAVKLQEDGSYPCAVSLIRKGERVLTACGTSDSIKNAATDVGHQYWLNEVAYG